MSDTNFTSSVGTQGSKSHGQGQSQGRDGEGQGLQAALAALGEDEAALLASLQRIDSAILQRGLHHVAEQVRSVGEGRMQKGAWRRSKGRCWMKV